MLTPEEPLGVKARTSIPFNSNTLINLLIIKLKIKHQKISCCEVTIFITELITIWHIPFVKILK